MRKVLIVTPFFLPNIGGAETYVFELTEYLRTHGCEVNVLTYQPVTTPGARGARLEKRENITIRRYQWIGFNLFNKLEKYPFINFLYLTPYLLLRSFIWMLFNHKKVEVIDAQGFNSA
jgi:glycosyltransferase involved in cell wall biosynthesis